MQSQILETMKGYREYTINDLAVRLKVQSHLLRTHLASLLRQGKIRSEDLKGVTIYKKCPL